jgi:hypothetical protein
MSNLFILIYSEGGGRKVHKVFQGGRSYNSLGTSDIDKSPSGVSEHVVLTTIILTVATVVLVLRWLQEAPSVCTEPTCI